MKMFEDHESEHARKTSAIENDFRLKIIFSLIKLNRFTNAPKLRNFHCFFNLSVLRLKPPVANFQECI